MPASEQSAQKARNPVASAMAALLLNAAFIAFPFAFSEFTKTVERERAWGYHLTDDAIKQMQNELDHAIVAELDPELSPKLAWRARIGQELAENDLVAARGLLLTAPRALPAEDVNRLYATMSTRGGEATLETAALAFLDPGAANHYRQLARFYESGAGAPMRLGGGADLTERALAFGGGQTSDQFALLLIGFGETLAAGGVGALASEDDPALLGASIALAAARNQGLDPLYAARLQTLLGRALALNRLQPALAQIVADDLDQAEAEMAVREAFFSSIEPTGAAALRAELTQIGDIGQRAGPLNAIRLIRLAQSSEDLARLELIAAAGDRAAAYAKLAPSREAFLGMVQPSLAISIAVGISLASLIGIGVLAALALFIVLKAEQRGKPQPNETPAPSPPIQRTQKKAPKTSAASLGSE